MADKPRFGQDRIKDIPPLNLLDALLAQGFTQDFLRPLVGKSTPEITSYVLRNQGDAGRDPLDRAVRMAQGEELGRLEGAKDDYERLRIGLEMRGVTLDGYTGKKDVQELARWASTRANPLALGNAIATTLPGHRIIGGFGVTDEMRQSVTLFSNPQTAPTPLGPPTEMQPGVRGQGGMGGGTDAGPKGPPTVTGTTTPAPALAPGAGGGGGAGGTPPPAKLTPEQIRSDIESRYGFGAAFMDIPEIAKILNDAAAGLISPEEANRRWLASDYYKNSMPAARNWKQLQQSSPGVAREQMNGQVRSITQRANSLGINLDPARAQQIADLSLTHGWSDQMIASAIASEARWDPDGAKTGVMAQIKGAQQSMLVPLSDQAMTQWAQAIVSGSQTIDDFNAYLKDQAKSLFPTMANYLDTTPGGNVRSYLEPYSQTIAKTMGMNPADIDWMDPKWFRFVNSTDPKTGERKMIDIADVQRTLIADPTYGYDQTTNGKQQKASLARTILQDWGFLAPSSGGGFA